jgi:lysylphosphatidylglycerol synthetase-like protein (DUF2156 family)
VSYAASLIIILLVFSFGESIHFISQFPNFSSGGESNLSNIINISSSEFLLAFNALGYALRYDLIIVLSLLPLTLGLFFKFRKENSKKIDSILVLILTALVAGPVMIMLTDFYFILPYRFLPLIVFVAVGIGVLLSKRN